MINIPMHHPLVTTLQQINLFLKVQALISIRVSHYREEKSTASEKKSSKMSLLHICDQKENRISPVVNCFHSLI